MSATTVNCPLCPVTVLGRGDDDSSAAIAAIEALEQHLNDHQHNLEGDQA